MNVRLQPSHIYYYEYEFDEIIKVVNKAKLYSIKMYVNIRYNINEEYLKYALKNQIIATTNLFKNVLSFNCYLSLNVVN